MTNSTVSTGTGWRMRNEGEEETHAVGNAPLVGRVERLVAVLLALLEARAALRRLVTLTSVSGTGVSLGLGDGRH